MNADLAIAPQDILLLKIFGHFQSGPPKLHPAGFGRRDALGLSLPDILPLHLRRVGHHRQHQVGDKRAQQIFAVGRVQQRGIITFMSARFSLVIIRHCSIISL